MSSHGSNISRFDAHPQRHSALGGFAWKTGLLLTAAVVGEGAMLLERSRQVRDARILDHVGDNPERLIIAQFGLNTNDEANAAAFKTNFSHLGEVACIVHPKAHVPLDRIMDKTLALCAKRPDAEVTLYGHSWGGFANSLMVSNPEFRSELGQVHNLIFENSFADSSAISWLGQALLWPAHLGPLSWAVGHVLPVANAPTYQTADMHNIARHNKIAPGAAENFADNIVCIQPQSDPYVNNVLALASIEALAGQKPVTHIVDGTTRPISSHNGATYYPEVFASIMEQTEHTSLANTAA
jgi:hypothetical protein